jgi:hypothetical protein
MGDPLRPGKEKKPTVELATMWHRKFFQVKGMIRPLTYGVWAFWPMKWLLEKAPFYHMSIKETRKKILNVSLFFKKGKFNFF